MGKVIELKAHRRAVPRPKPTLRELVERVHELSKDSDNFGFLHPHLQERMRLRGKSMRDVLETLRKGEGVKGPDLDQFGDYRIKLRRYVCGKRIQVVVAVRQNDFTVVTVI
jgi:Domain of unknown function (DUF4258)